MGQKDSRQESGSEEEGGEVRAVLVLVLSALSCLAQQKSIRVKLTVQSSDSDLRQSLQSYLSRELRSIGDIELVDADDAQFRMYVLAYDRGREAIVSATFTGGLGFLGPMTEGCESLGCKALRETVPGLDMFLMMKTEVCPSTESQLRDLSSKLITYFDSNALHAPSAKAYAPHRFSKEQPK